jgi:hypothetical protein
MKRVISISEIVAPVQVENDLCEVWASGDAGYGEAKAELEVKLSAFLRRSTDNKRLTANWLPSDQTVTERMDFEEASSAAKEIFESWVQRVRRATQRRFDGVPSPTA